MRRRNKCYLLTCSDICNPVFQHFLCAFIPYFLIVFEFCWFANISMLHPFCTSDKLHVLSKMTLSHNVVEYLEDSITLSPESKHRSSLHYLKNSAITDQRFSLQWKFIMRDIVLLRYPLQDNDDSTWKWQFPAVGNCIHIDSYYLFHLCLCSSQVLFLFLYKGTNGSIPHPHPLTPF